MIQVGLITEPNNKKALAKVAVDGRVTDWLPVISMSGKFKRVYSPASVDDQVLVINPHGNNENGFILRGVFSKNLKTPEKAGDDCEVTEYEDGTIITYDKEAKELNVETKSKIIIKVDNDVIIECKKATIKADKITLDGDTKIIGNLEVTKSIKDKKGDLTGHKHKVTGHNLAEPRP